MTDLDPVGLEPDQTQITGTLHHRISDTMTDHGGGLSLLYTQLLISPRSNFTHQVLLTTLKGLPTQT